MPPPPGNCSICCLGADVNVLTYEGCTPQLVSQYALTMLKREVEPGDVICMNCFYGNFISTKKECEINQSSSSPTTVDSSHEGAEESTSNSNCQQSNSAVYEEFIKEDEKSVVLSDGVKEILRDCDEIDDKKCAYNVYDWAHQESEIGAYYKNNLMEIEISKSNFQTLSHKGLGQVIKSEYDNGSKELIIPVTLENVFTTPSATLNVAAECSGVCIRKPSPKPIIENSFTLNPQNCFSDVSDKITPAPESAPKAKVSARKLKRHIFLKKGGLISNKFISTKTKPTPELEPAIPFEKNLSEKISCKSCTKKVKSSEALLHHENQSHCRFCDKSFACETRLKQHVGNTIKCNQLNNGSNNKKEKFTCRVCYSEFNTPREKEVHHLEKICVCGKKYQCRKRYSSHVVTRCEATKRQQQYNKKIKASCKSCKTTFADRSALEKHMEQNSQCKNSSSTETPEPSAGDPLPSLKNNSLESQTPPSAVAIPPQVRPSIKISLPFKLCSFCHMRFFGSGALEKHLKVSNCPRCGFLQPCGHLLKTHLSECRFEAAEGQHTCPLCTKNFLSAALLGTHVALEHSGPGRA